MSNLDVVAAMDVNELPKLRITGINNGQCAARFDPSPYIGEAWIGCAYITDGRFVWGRFVQVDMTNNTCVFKPNNLSELALMQVDQAYPSLDGYWGERAELVLDPERLWEKTRFEPSGAISFKNPSGVLVAPAAETTFAGGEVIKGGWDHEHCAICWESLGSGGQEEGFLSRPKTWVCERCYTEFIERRSLAFMDKDSK